MVVLYKPINSLNKKEYCVDISKSVTIKRFRRKNAPTFFINKSPFFKPFLHFFLGSFGGVLVEGHFFSCICGLVVSFFMLSHDCVMDLNYVFVSRSLCQSTALLVDRLGFIFKGVIHMHILLHSWFSFSFCVLSHPLVAINMSIK